MSMLAAAAAVLTITVRVYDLYGLPPDQRAEALAVAAEALAQANVSANWVDCTRVNGVAPPLCLAILKPGEMVLRFQDRSPRGPHILGTALVQEGGPNVMASVYAESTAERSVKARLPVATLLGRVTAHEVGHLLLGTNSHAPRGLMRAAWDLKQPHPSEWQFTRADAARIRGGLMQRAVAQVVGGAPVETTRMATTVMSSARPFDPAKSSNATGTSDR